MTYFDPNLWDDLLQLELLRRAEERQRQRERCSDAAEAESPETLLADPAESPSSWLHKALRGWRNWGFVRLL